MRKFAITTVTAGALVAGALGFAASAGAIALGGSPMEGAIRTLQAEGSPAQINQSVNVPLSRCTVANVGGLRGIEDSGILRDPGQFNVTTPFIDCTD